jgi:hypothetical protein
MMQTQAAAAVAAAGWLAGLHGELGEHHTEVDIVLFNTAAHHISWQALMHHDWLKLIDDEEWAARLVASSSPICACTACP